MPSASPPAVACRARWATSDRQDARLARRGVGVRGHGHVAAARRAIRRARRRWAGPGSGRRRRRELRGGDGAVRRATCDGDAAGRLWRAAAAHPVARRGGRATRRRARAGPRRTSRSAGVPARRQLLRLGCRDRGRTGRCADAQVLGARRHARMAALAGGRSAADDRPARVVVLGAVVHARAGGARARRAALRGARDVAARRRCAGAAARTSRPLARTRSRAAGRGAQLARDACVRRRDDDLLRRGRLCRQRRGEGERREREDPSRSGGA